jgi:hypothetical protein
MRLSFFLLLLTFLVGCEPVASNRSLYHPNDLALTCQGTTCCYPAANRTTVCYVDQPYYRSTFIYYNVIEK